jgi:hypothetical protein
VIAPPPDWVRHIGAQLVSLYPPEGGGRIRCYERIRPARTLSQVVAFVVEQDPAFRLVALDAPARVLTTEGEHAGWVRVTGVRDDAPSVRFVGAVFTDEFVLALDAMVAVPDRALRIEAVARELLLGATFGLGVRRRRFYYEPPPGWQPLLAGLVASWYPPGFPDDHVTIVVHPAAPSHEPAAVTFDAFLAGEQARGAAVEGKVEENEIVAAGGLAGRHWSFATRRGAQHLHREVVVFTAAPYTYALRMESTSTTRLDEHRAIFAAVARSAQPVPAAGERLDFGSHAHTTSALSHWFD